MAINPLQLPDPVKAPLLDFTPLLRIGQAYGDSRRKQELADTIAGVTSPDGTIDYAKAGTSLLKLGQTDEANKLFTLAETRAKHTREDNAVFGTPIYGTDAQGNTAIGTFDKNGKFRPIETPGFKPTPGVKTVDTGTGTVVIDSRSGVPVSGNPAPSIPSAAAPSVPQSSAVPQPSTPRQPAGYIPKDVKGEARDKEAGGVEGKNLGTLGKAEAAYKGGIASLDDFEQTANQLLTHKGLTGILGWQGMLPNIPGGSAADAQAIYDKLVAKGTFAELQKMREQSPTGGALGAVSDAENAKLQAAFAALARTQGTPQFKDELAKVLQQIKESKLRITGAYRQDYERLKNGGENGAPATTLPKVTDRAAANAAIAAARQAIADGADPKKVNERLRQMGVPPIAAGP